MSQSEGPTAILVVDDEQAILSALKKFLTVKGYDVSTAASGEEALDVTGGLALQKRGLYALPHRRPDDPGALENVVATLNSRLGGT